MMHLTVSAFSAPYILLSMRATVDVLTIYSSLKCKRQNFAWLGLGRQTLPSTGTELLLNVADDLRAKTDSEGCHSHSIQHTDAVSVRLSELTLTDSSAVFGPFCSSVFVSVSVNFAVWPRNVVKPGIYYEKVCPSISQSLHLSRSWVTPKWLKISNIHCTTPFLFLEAKFRNPEFRGSPRMNVKERHPPWRQRKFDQFSLVRFLRDILETVHVS